MARGGVSFRPSASGVRAALRSDACESALKARTDAIASRANSMYSLDAPNDGRAYVSKSRKYPFTAVALAGTGSDDGMVDNSKHNTLLKARGW